MPLVLILTVAVAQACTERLPDGFEDLGAAVPSGREFGIYAAVDHEGRPIVFVKLVVGSYATYLFIDAETGETEQVDPQIGGRANSRTALMLGNRVYDSMGDWFLEIDIAAREVRRVGEVPSQGLTHSYAMDADGTVYGGVFPSGTLVSYNAGTGKYNNYGPINEESWNQYLRPMVAGQDGWIYVGIGQNLAQIVGFNPADKETRAFVPEKDRKRGQGYVVLGRDGQVYANAEGWSWHRMWEGKAIPVDVRPVGASLRTDIFPDGSRILDLDLFSRTIRILDRKTNETRQVNFDYVSPGVDIFSMVAGPDGNIYGGTGAPNRFWRFNPATGEFNDWGFLAGLGLHANQMVLQGEKIYAAVYSTGSLVEIDPLAPYDDNTEIQASKNPRLLHGGQYGYLGDPDMFGRPYAMLAHPDGKHVIMAGNPARVEIGGGMLIYNTETGVATPLFPDQLIPDQGVRALAALPDGDVIVGSTITSATAGEQSKATEAMLYRLDWDTREVVERWVVDPAVSGVEDFVVADNGLVFGLTTGAHTDTAVRFFVFNPETGEFVHREQIIGYGGLTGSQASRTMALGPDGGIYVLFRDAIIRIEPDTFSHAEIARPGVPITAGIVIYDGWLYFGSCGRLYRYSL